MYDNKPFHIIIGLINFSLLFIIIGLIGYFVFYGPAQTTEQILEIWAYIRASVQQIRP